jgi:hypothetical protein
MLMRTSRPFAAVRCAEAAARPTGQDECAPDLTKGKLKYSAEIVGLIGRTGRIIGVR